MQAQCGRMTDGMTGGPSWAGQVRSALHAMESNRIQTLSDTGIMQI